MTEIKMTLKQATEIVENGGIVCDNCPFDENACYAHCGDVALKAAEIYYEHKLAPKIYDPEKEYKMTEIEMTLEQATRIVENGGSKYNGKKYCTIDCIDILLQAAKIYHEHKLAPKIYDPEKEYTKTELTGMLLHACRVINPFLPKSDKLAVSVNKTGVGLFSDDSVYPKIKFKREIKPPKKRRVVEDIHGNLYVSFGTLNERGGLNVTRRNDEFGPVITLLIWRDYLDPKHHSEGWKDSE